MEEKLAALQNWFETSGKTLAFAESCTGGLLSATLAARPGVSKFFLGSVVSYQGSVKRNILGVPENLLRSMGEVSIPVALHMARGVKAALKSDYAVSVTGIAGPGGGSADKPVGTVCFAVVGPGLESAVTKQFSPKERRKIQLESVEFAIDFLWGSIHA